MVSNVNCEELSFSILHTSQKMMNGIFYLRQCIYTKYRTTVQNADFWRMNVGAIFVCKDSSFKAIPSSHPVHPYRLDDVGQWEHSANMCLMLFHTFFSPLPSLHAHFSEWNALFSNYSRLVISPLQALVARFVFSYFKVFSKEILRCCKKLTLW